MQSDEMISCGEEAIIFNYQCVGGIDYVNIHIHPNKYAGQ